MTMTADERVQRAWANLELGPGWEDRLSALMAEEIREAVADALSAVWIQTMEVYTSGTPRKEKQNGS